MRRKDREITDPAEMETILQEATIIRLAMTDGDQPYVVPLCFGYADNTIYFHSAHEGRKIALLTRNPRCCIEVDKAVDPIPAANPCSWEFRYKSVICTGTAQFIKDPDEKRRGLNCILQHYGAAEYPFTDTDLDRVCVVRIAIQEMTGKKYAC
jgi:nitroimidazol reductase NimA-like FMN-containing flavoprotein (pyridoxamine 5'-phosphate oxidase superfamily)